MVKDSKAEPLPQLCSSDQPRTQNSFVETNVARQEICETLDVTARAILLTHFTKRKPRGQLKEHQYLAGA